eukprot:CAMPEP_0118985554 /NCGR_PEP_ID=MMETSP1173-20130426/40271_1 /TAXON_ID=1034831 /ORGANISM="Rhizochromulina marina cf, Strain CCMP1243" /LENGTH=88 /DNA_ID=CAMNT_0006936287 /DNA_START=832 /DNA_END=1095 /DNA_ORIENTATION=+
MLTLAVRPQRTESSATDAFVKLAVGAPQSGSLMDSVNGMAKHRGEQKPWLAQERDIEDLPTEGPRRVTTPPWDRWGTAAAGPCLLTFP